MCFFVVVFVWVLTTINYEIGYENGTRGCYGCGLLSEPALARWWEPWFDFSEEVK
jgi:hypothetical protein